MPQIYEMDAAATERLEQYFLRIGTHLKDRRKRESFAIYAFGILGDTDRKSVEPIAAAACGDPERTVHMHDKLLHFVGQSRWSDEAVRLEASRYVVDALAAREPITTWIIDDTGFLKQGTHSVGVQRQYTGSAGKICNCQIGVSLAITTATEQVPIDFQLYLPQSWTDNRARRREAHIPDEVQFKSKVDLAIDMIERAARAGVPGEVILADSAYGKSSEFRETVRTLGFDYAVAVRNDTKICRIGAHGRLGTSIRVRDVAQRVPRRQRRTIAWREGTKATLSSRFHFCRVKVASDDGMPIDEREPIWLVIEYPPGEEPKFALTTLPRRMSHKQIVRTLRQRWRIERTYEDLKGELGLDHFEGRSFPGWHHHVSVVLCCYAFVVAERVRAFPPSGGRTSQTHAVNVAA